MRTHFRSPIFAALALTLALGTAPAAIAVTVDLSHTPLVIGTTMAIPPNIFFILDDSSTVFRVGAGFGEQRRGKQLLQDAGYNRMYYDPTVTYTPPLMVNADGTT